MHTSKGSNMNNNQKTNELYPELLGPNSLNPYHENTSASRGQMFSTHLGQRLVINGATPRAIQTGMEREYGKYTFKVDMPVTGVILEVIPRYQRTGDINSIAHNPQTIVIYEDVETKEIGIVNIEEYCCNHQYFGFRFQKRKALDDIRVGMTIEKGKVFLDSPAISDEGDYAYGIQANVAYMTHPATSEDGILVRKGFLPSLGFRTYETRTIEWGRDKIALNLYGTEENPLPFPDIGAQIRPDGLVMALRHKDLPELAVVERSVKDCMEVEYTFDETVYAAPGGKVVDVRIWHHQLDTNIAPTHADQQPQRYDAARRQFYRRILDTWKRLHKRQGDALQITPEFQNLVAMAESVCGESKDQRVYKVHRNAPMDVFRVDIVIEYLIIPTTGFKLTDCFGKEIAAFSSNAN